jgi:4-hydroxythreonine-4-phosphate dehydrogenase
VPGQPTARSGAAQVEYLEAAIAAATRGEISGLVTAPIHKASAKAAGLAFPGHTELLAARLPGDGQVVMMLAGPQLRVALCTTHLALSAVPQALTSDGIVQVLRTTALALHHDFAIAAPRLWVAGLNPHAGESGHFGDEETRIIAPAISAALALPELRAMRNGAGLHIEGPLVPDAVFRAAVHPPAGTPRPDAVIAMYHDQGLIPLKLIDFDDAVNVSLGLRIVRTSPDHGVAHDIAGRGIARPHSQRHALRLGAELVQRRARQKS